MFLGDFAEEHKEKIIIVMIVVRVRDFKRIMEQKGKIWESLGAMKEGLGTLSGIFWAENLRPESLATNM